jgi:hypothetical protein
MLSRRFRHVMYGSLTGSRRSLSIVGDEAGRPWELRIGREMGKHVVRAWRDDWELRSHEVAFLLSESERLHPERFGWPGDGRQAVC